MFLKFTIIYLNPAVTTARFFNVESCVVFKQSAIKVTNSVHVSAISSLSFF